MTDAGEVATDPERLIGSQRRRKRVDLLPLLSGQRRWGKFNGCHRVCLHALTVQDTPPLRRAAGGRIKRQNSCSARNKLISAAALPGEQTNDLAAIVQLFCTMCAIR